MNKVCRQCGDGFEVTDQDLIFYDKVSPIFKGEKYSISAPTFCPDCRQQRRLSFRNERSLYKRECALTGKEIISLYSPNSPFKVYNQSDWWECVGLNTNFGRSFDFSRSFFEQFKELSEVVPRPSIHVVGNENCDYVNQCGYSKNCYLSFNTDFSEGCLYCRNVTHSKDCIDILDGDKSELCYFSTEVSSCYNVIYSSQCKKCSDLILCENMIGCTSCFGCINLRNRKYCFFNEQLDEAEYLEKISLIDLGVHGETETYKEKFESFRLTQPHVYANINQCDNTTGDYLLNCKNARNCYHSFSNEDVANCIILSQCKDTYDFDIGGYECELCLEVVSSGDKDYHCLFSLNIWGNSADIIYSDTIINSNNLFGCYGLSHKQYCILNKQYSKEEYESLVPRIIKHMQNTGEWGEFFDTSMSPFGYNESVAQEYYPIKKEKVILNGWHWKEDESKEKILFNWSTLPKNIQDIDDSISDEKLSCMACGGNYKIVKNELDSYRKWHVSIPMKCPNCRYKERMDNTNPLKLWNRFCAKCEKAIRTTYAPDRKEIVYCKECYLKEVY